MKENILKPLPVGELLEYSFYVDSYQRGYRWGQTEVEALLKDITDFAEKPKIPNESYWLQPIIVKKVEKSIDDELIKCYELIDGQQRLTTIFLILNYLRNTDVFKIHYNTRTSSRDFLTTIITIEEFNSWDEYLLQTKENDKIDNFHFFTAYKIIQTYFQRESKGKIDLFLKTLLKQTNIIWYELVEDNADPKIIFEQINIGKIPLTNAELVKALYLNSTVDKVRRDEIASKWDRIEYALNDNHFWAFISNDVSKTHNRIEYILDLLSGKFDSDKNKEEKLHTFLHFYNAVNKNGMWNFVENHYQILLGWFETSELYHYVGYLIATNLFTITDLIKLYNKSSNQPKSEFKVEIISEIENKIKNYNIESLSYENNSDKEKIKNVLLLFNIQTNINTTPYSYFPFHQYKSTHWSLEHIHAQQSDSLKDPEAIKAWIEETKPIVESFFNDINKSEKAKQLIEDFDNALSCGANIKIGDLPEKVYSFFEGDKEGVHLISNMALLDGPTNSSLNKSVFPVKRKRIFEAEDSKKVFIPICTKNVFLKFYSDDVSHMQFWSKTDKEDYTRKMFKCLEMFKTENK